MGFFGEQISGQKIELEVPEHYSLNLLQACLCPAAKCKEATTLFVQTTNESEGFALCSLGGSASQPVRFSSLAHDFGPEDSPLILYTTGEKIHLTGSWKWSAEAPDIDDESDGSISDEGDLSQDDINEKEVSLRDESHASEHTVSGKRKLSETNEQKSTEVEQPPEKKTFRNKRGNKEESSTVLPASELVVVSKPPVNGIELKAWKIKPQNDEGIIVPSPKQKTMKTGVLITDYVVGKGAEPKLGSAVKITYEGSFPDGKIFDKNLSRKKPLTFRIGSGQVIRGLDLGMDKMRVGGSRQIVIPPALGYGKEGLGDIPPNQMLVFRITLVGIQKKSLSKR